MWDVFFLEGHDSLFRVALGILKLNEGEMMACESVGDLFALIGGMTGRLWVADRLIAVSISVWGWGDWGSGTWVKGESGGRMGGKGDWGVKSKK